MSELFLQWINYRTIVNLIFWQQKKPWDRLVMISRLLHYDNNHQNAQTGLSPSISGFLQQDFVVLVQFFSISWHISLFLSMFSSKSRSISFSQKPTKPLFKPFLRFFNLTGETDRLFCIILTAQKFLLLFYDFAVLLAPSFAKCFLSYALVINNKRGVCHCFDFTRTEFSV